MSSSTTAPKHATPCAEGWPANGGAGGVVIASASRIFRDGDTRWTLEATCAACSAETVAPLVMGAAILCSGCGAVIRVDPGKTTYHAHRP